MNHSLVGANGATHLKIVAVAIMASILVGAAAYANQFPANSNYTAAAAKPAGSHSYARIERATVCRFSEL